MRRVEREQGLGLNKERQIKVGCCEFAVAQKEDALRFMKLLQLR